MMNRKEDGFSLIELLLVVVVIGIIAALAVPALQKATRAAENGTTFATLRTIGSAQVSYYQQNGRFARVTEINNLSGGSIGSNSGNDVIRGKSVFSMVPATPTDPELRVSYTINAVRNISGEGVTYRYELTQSGEIHQISPACTDGFCS
jgi:prepilin-type N-terminal cleavage/methylation domain-containing protein